MAEKEDVVEKEAEVEEAELEVAEVAELEVVEVAEVAELERWTCRYVRCLR